ncbi:MAG: hypothetical protein F6K40_04010 [Okeania sp. SIO3I5]|nr:hypothetical protein [Okeania sp. SIO3I5]NEQ35508.1 hypothetical protein [Okeania sp. SIO3I5]
MEFCQVGVVGDRSFNISRRKWIGKQSFEEQQDFGVRVVRAFGGTI